VQVGEGVGEAMEAAVAALEREVAPVTGAVVSELADRFVPSAASDNPLPRCVCTVGGIWEERV